MRWWRTVLALLLMVASLLSAGADARGRSGGGFGGSGSFRTPSYSRPFSQPRTYSAPRGNTFNSGSRGFGMPHFVFLPFFGFHPFGLGYGYGGGFGASVLGFLFNIVLFIALIAFVVWLVRRFRRR